MKKITLVLTALLLAAMFAGCSKFRDSGLDPTVEVVPLDDVTEQSEEPVLTIAKGAVKIVAESSLILETDDGKELSIITIDTDFTGKESEIKAGDIVYVEYMEKDEVLLATRISDSPVAIP